MSIKSAIKQGIMILSNPDKEFLLMKERTFEDILEDYIKFLLMAGLMAGIAAIIYQFSRAAYLDIFKSIAIDYWRLLNYSVGTAVSTFFFYLFIGIFLIFLISLIVKLFARGLKYTHLLSIMAYSVSPLLIFNWIHESLFSALMVWTLFLLIKGIRSAKSSVAKDHKKSEMKGEKKAKPTR